VLLLPIDVCSQTAPRLPVSGGLSSPAYYYLHESPKFPLDSNLLATAKVLSNDIRAILRFKILGSYGPFPTLHQHKSA
jgi:hypothetical protein